MRKPLTLVLAFLATAPLAHSKQEATTPAAEATVAAVAEISLRFDDLMLVTAVTLVGPEGDVPLTRDTAMEPMLEFRAIPDSDLPAGAYVVEWRGLAADGHPMQGRFTFTVAPD